MPKTLKEAMKRARKFRMELPDMDVIIIDNTKTMGRNSIFRYNYNFRRKRSKMNKILIQKR